MLGPCAAADYPWRLPRGFPVPAVPADNPMSQPKVELGRRLFFEPKLSVTGRYSCASCHDPGRSYADARAQARGATGQTLPHNAMALVNVAYNVSFGWDQPRLRSLEAQMLVPLMNEHPVELGLRGRAAAVCAQLAQQPEYARGFAQAFPGEATPVTLANLIRAIAAFERTLIFGRSPFDRYVFEGEHTALSPQAKRGMALFFSARAGCSSCHSGFGRLRRGRRLLHGGADGRGRSRAAGEWLLHRPRRAPRHGLGVPQRALVACSLRPRARRLVLAFR